VAFFFAGADFLTGLLAMVFVLFTGVVWQDTAN